MPDDMDDDLEDDTPGNAKQTEASKAAVKKLAQKAAKAILLKATPQGFDAGTAPAGKMAFDFGESETLAIAKSRISRIIGAGGGGSRGGSGAGGVAGGGGISLPSTKKRNSLLVSRLVEEKEAEDERKKKLQRHSRQLQEMEAYDAAQAACDVLMEKQQRAADALQSDVLARGREAEDMLGGGELDDTPCPPDITKALGDTAFAPPPSDPEDPRGHAPPRDCGAPPPRDLAKYVRAAEAGCVARVSLRDADVADARGEVLREVLACGWLSREFTTKLLRRNALQDTAVCAPETSRWFFEVATDPASTREVVLGARDALFAAAGFEAGADGSTGARD